jgi:hypothetical protein
MRKINDLIVTIYALLDVVSIILNFYLLINGFIINWKRNVNKIYYNDLINALFWKINLNKNKIILINKVITF